MQFLLPADSLDALASECPAEFNPPATPVSPVKSPAFASSREPRPSSMAATGSSTQISRWSAELERWTSMSCMMSAAGELLFVEHGPAGLAYGAARSLGFAAPGRLPRALPPEEVEAKSTGKVRPKEKTKTRPGLNAPSKSPV